MSIDNVRVDDTSVDFSPDHRVIPLYEYEEWARATIHGTLTLPDVVENVFPDSEQENPPGKLYIAVRSLETIYRDRVAVSDSPVRPDSYEFTMSLPFERVRGDVRLIPFLVRAEEGSDDTVHGTTRGVRLASGKSWTAQVDDPEAEEEAKFIEGETKRFSEDTALPDSDRLYYLDLRNPEQPKLWLNSDHQRITEVVHSDGTMGASARMRDVVLDQIQYSVWTQLVMRTAADIDSSTLEPRYEWQEVVITIFGPKLYGTEDEIEIARQLRNDASNANDLPYLLEQLDLALQEHIDPREQLINLIEEGLQI